jgi:hypothetical protein
MGIILPARENPANYVASHCAQGKSRICLFSHLTRQKNCISSSQDFIHTNRSSFGKVGSLGSCSSMMMGAGLLVLDSSRRLMLLYLFSSSQGVVHRQMALL